MQGNSSISIKDELTLVLEYVLYVIEQYGENNSADSYELMYLNELA